MAILPRPTLENEIELGTLVAVPLAGSKFTRPLGIIHRKGRKFYPNTEAFIEVLKHGTNGVHAKNGNGVHTNGELRPLKTQRRSKAKV